MSSQYRRLHLQYHANRRAYSLIETLCMIMLLGSMMSLTGVAIHRVTQTQKLVLSTIRHAKLLEDLYQSISRDSQTASKLQTIDNTIELLQVDGQTVRYSCETGQIVRSITSNSGELQSQNRWSIGAKSMEAKVDSSGTIPLASYDLVLQRMPVDPAVASVSMGDDITENTAASTGNAALIHWVTRLGGER